MKTVKLIAYLVIFLATILCAVLLLKKFNCKEKTTDSIEVETFVLKESRWCLGAMEKFPCDEVVGPVLTAEEAVEKAIDIWLNHFGEKIRDQAPYRVFYDEAEDIWYIRGADLPENMKGGYAEILIERSTGRILAVWHSM